MSLFLYHAPAVALYDSGTIKRPDESARCTLPTDHVPSFKDRGIRRMLEKLSIPEPLLVAAPTAATRRNIRNRYSLVVRDPLLREQFYTLSEQVFIATPELALLSVTPDMNQLELTMLISEMCSRFAIDPTAEYGYRDREPITSRTQILQFLETVKSHPGIPALRKAASLAVEGARSPAEVKFTLRLTLPRRLYGYGIERPTVNGTVTLPVHGLSRLSSREVDFVWEKQRFAAEYDSDERHGETTRSADTIRANEITSAGYTVVSIVPEQAATVTSMNQLVAGMATHIYGHRSAANLKLLHQFILQPDDITRHGREDLRKELNRLYDIEPWKIPLARRQARIAISRDAIRANRRQHRQKTEDASESTKA